jgi:hypothetical protein
MQKLIEVLMLATSLAVIVFVSAGGMKIERTCSADDAEKTRHFSFISDGCTDTARLN